MRVDRDQLGEPIEAVARRMAEALRSHAVDCDAPAFDGFWLRRLFEASSLPRPLRLQPMLQLLRRVASDGTILAAEAIAQRVAPHTHRAADDVRHLLAIYRIFLRGVSGDPRLKRWGSHRAYRI